MGKGLEWTFLFKKICSQQAHEKMLNIISHQGMQIKTTMRSHFTPPMVTGIYFKRKITKLESPYIADKNVK